MPVLRVNNYIDAYRLRAQADDIHEMAARPDKKPLTEFVNRQILEMIEAGPEDVLVDIGCGDASLLRLSRVSKAVGIVSTAEEQQKLASAFGGIKFIASAAQSLPLESASASKIVCNATLVYLPSEEDVSAALRELARIARPGVTVWLGEIPEIDEYAHYGIYRGSSMVGFLGHILRRNGLRAVLGMIRRWIRAISGREQIVLNSAGLFYASPGKMIALAESCGLKLKAHFRHRELDAQGRVADSQFRYDYIFTV
jgi:hypothetical protein